MIQPEKQKTFVTHCRDECWKQKINQVMEMKVGVRNEVREGRMSFYETT